MRQPFDSILRDLSQTDSAPRRSAAERLQCGVAPNGGTEARNFDNERAVAFADGMAIGRAEMRAAAELELQEVRADAEHRFADIQAKFSSAVFEALTVGLEVQLADLRARLIEQVATAVLPVLRHALTEATVCQLARELQALVGDATSTSVVLSGPAEFVDRIRAQYLDHTARRNGTSAPRVTIDYGATVDVRIIVDDVVVESRLMEWIARMMGALS